MSTRTHADDSVQDRAAIERQVEHFVAAYNAGDVEALMRCYALDLIKLRQGAPPERWHETAERIAQVMRTHRGELEVQNEEIVVDGALAYVRGTLQIRLEPRAGRERQWFSRRFLEIWRKQDGKWLVARTMDNSA